MTLTKKQCAILALVRDSLNRAERESSATDAREWLWDAQHQLDRMLKSIIR